MKEIDHHDSQAHWLTSIIEVIQWFYFLNTTEHTADNIETQIMLLPLLLKMFAMFKTRLWYDKENLKENVLENIAIRCSNGGKTTVLSVKNKNTNNKLC